MKIKRIIPILIVGLAIRLVIAAFTFHPDVRIISYTSAIILGHGNLNPYEKDVFKTETPDDLPLQYWIRIPVETVLRPLINQEIENQFLLDVSKLYGDSRLWLHLLVIKIPLIIFDIGLGFLLMLLVSKEKSKKIFTLWMLNPMTLWATSAVGQIDIMPTFFIILSTVLLSKGKRDLSALSLGIGGALKSFPFLIAPFIILQGESWKERIKLGFLVLIPVLITILPYIKSAPFKQNALFAPQLDKMLYAKIPISGGEAIIVTVAITIFLYSVYLQKRRTVKDFINFSFITLLLILAFTHFHIQWFLWITPYLVLFIAERLLFAQKISLWFLSLSVVLMLVLFEQSLQVGLLSPILPNLSITPGLSEVLQKTQVDFLKNIAATIFASSAFYFCYSRFKES